MGKQVHDEVVSLGLLRQDAVVGNALVDMYAKCGMIQRAQQVHDELSTRDVVSWNALITGYAHQGQGKEALHCFQLMQREGFSPDGMTLLGVLNACSHCGRFNEAQTYFSSMSCKYGLAPNIEHHTCVIVALGRIGCFDEVMSMISMLPTSYDPPLWLALLNACKKWGNMEVAKSVFAQILRLDNNCAAASYAIMDQMYATACMQEDARTEG
jgi:pentatricopeptide repeat protein